MKEGSLHRAAVRLRTSQSALSRQMQTLEHELGGRLLERTSTGVKPTASGLVLAEKMTPVLSAYDRALGEARLQIKGGSPVLRIGFMASAVRESLDSILKRVRALHPSARFKLHDLTPGEQYRALSEGTIDVGVVDESAKMFDREFHHRSLAITTSCVALACCHPLAEAASVSISDLRKDSFVNLDDQDLPGLTRKTTNYCRKVGKFRPRLVGHSHNLADSLQIVANENAVIILPAFMIENRHPGVVLLPLAEKEVTWDIMVVWQRGKPGSLLKTFLDALISLKLPATTKFKN